MRLYKNRATPLKWITNLSTPPARNNNSYFLIKKLKQLIFLFHKGDV